MVPRRSVYANLINELREMWPKEAMHKEDQGILDAETKELNFVMNGNSVFPRIGTEQPNHHLRRVPIGFSDL
jgi:hypothetical protein